MDSQEAAAFVNVLYDLAAAAGVRLVLETRFGCLTQDLDYMARLVPQVPRLALSLDVSEYAESSAQMSAPGDLRSRLDHLLDPGFWFQTEPEDRIAAVRLRRIRLVPTVPVPAMESLESRLFETATHGEALDLIDRLLSGVGLDRTQVRVVHVGIQLQFLSDGRRRGKTMTFHVSCPNTCDLKSKPDDVRVVGERCIRRWGILL
jgi:hypothetical protein